MVPDQGWWVIVVEFQLSSFAGGSYLNVGCHWLWHVRPYLSFDEGYRVAEFVMFENEGQFSASAEVLAQRAAAGVVRYRQLFPSIGDLSDFYLRKDPAPGWPSFNAAVAHGLSGRIRAAQRAFDCWRPQQIGEPGWIRDARSDSKHLSALVVHQDRFAQEVKARITRLARSANSQFSLKSALREA